MRVFGLTVVALLFAAVPVRAQSIGTGKTYSSVPDSTPGEPPTAVLLMTGMAGIAFVGLKRGRSEE